MRILKIVPVIILLAAASIFWSSWTESASQMRARIAQYHKDPSAQCSYNSSYDRCLSLDVIERSEYMKAPSRPLIPHTLMRRVGAIQDLESLNLTYTSAYSVAPLRNAPNLRSLVMDITHLSRANSLATLNQLTDLSIGTLDGTSLDWVPDLEQLETLNLSASHTDNLEPLDHTQAMISMRYTTDSNSSLDQLAGIRQLSELSILAANWSYPNAPPAMPTDLSPLAFASTLRVLHLSQVGAADLTPLSSLPRLEYFSAGDALLSDVSPLENLTTLKRLHLYNTAVADLTPLEGLENLEHIDLSFSDITDLAPLSGLARLRELHLDGHSPIDLTPLTQLPALEKLYLGNRKCHADPEQIRALTANGVSVYPNAHQDPDDYRAELCPVYFEHIARYKADGFDACLYSGGCAESRR